MIVATKPWVAQRGARLVVVDYGDRPGETRAHITLEDVHADGPAAVKAANKGGPRYKRGDAEATLEAASAGKVPNTSVRWRGSALLGVWAPAFLLRCGNLSHLWWCVHGGAVSRSSMAPCTARRKSTSTWSRRRRTPSPTKTAPCACSHPCRTPVVSTPPCPVCWACPSTRCKSWRVAPAVVSAAS